MIEAQLGVHLFVLGQFRFELFDPRQVGYFESAILGFPFVEGRLCDAELAADLFYRCATFLFLDGIDDLCFGES